MKQSSDSRVIFSSDGGEHPCYTVDDKMKGLYWHHEADTDLSKYVQCDPGKGKDATRIADVGDPTISPKGEGKGS